VLVWRVIVGCAAVHFSCLRPAAAGIADGPIRLSL
jgi:hypothetical protein